MATYHGVNMERVDPPYNNPGRCNNKPPPPLQSRNSTGSVGFQVELDNGRLEERKKFLTAKYGKHQMALIRKRLKVEEWVDDRLRELYGCVNDTDTYEAEIDLDEVLDLDDIMDRRNFILEQITDCRQSKENINTFVTELLAKAETL